MLEHNAIVVGRHFDNLCKFQSVITLSKEPSPCMVVVKIAPQDDRLSIDLARDTKTDIMSGMCALAH